MSRDNSSSEDGFTINEWMDTPLVEYDHTDRARAEIDPLILELVAKADEIGIPLFVALQVSQDATGARYSSTTSWQEPGQLSGGMLALEDALALDGVAVIKTRAAQIARLEKLGLIQGGETVIH